MEMAYDLSGSIFVNVAVLNDTPLLHNTHQKERETR